MSRKAEVWAALVSSWADLQVTEKDSGRVDGLQVAPKKIAIYLSSNAKADQSV